MIAGGLRAVAGKEVRALLPAFAGCVAVLAGARPSGLPLHRTTLLLVYGFTSLGIGAHVFGQEYAHRTLPMLLAMPVARWRLLAVKLAVALSFIGGLAIVAASSHGSAPVLRDTGAARFVSLVALTSVTLAPALAILCRSTLAGVVFTAGMAAGLWLLAGAVGAWQLGAENAAGIDAFQRAVFWPGIYGLCGIGAAATAWLYLRLEAPEDAGAGLQLPALIRRTPGGAIGVTRRSPWIRLVQKELRLQQSTFILSAMFVAAMLMSAAIAQEDAGNAGWTVPVLFFHAIAVAGLAGCLASAEERQLGTWASQQLMPVGAREQWLVKAAVTLGTAMGLAILVPVILADVLPPVARGDVIRPGTWTRFGLLTAVALYISALSRSGIRAVVGLILIVPAIGLVVGPLHRLLWTLVRTGMERVMTIPRPWDRFVPDPASYYLDAMAVAFTVIVLVFAFRNHRADNQDGWRIAGQLAVMGSFVAVAFAGGLVLRLATLR